MLEETDRDKHHSVVVCAAVPHTRFSVGSESFSQPREHRGGWGDLGVDTWVLHLLNTHLLCMPLIV